MLNTSDGGFPDSHKGGTITQAIFDRYHNDLYPGVTAFREEYVLPYTKSHNTIHLNWGLQLATDNPEKDIRTTNNANFQGYSNLTCIAAVKFRNLYLSQGNPHNILGLNIIHDALTKFINYHSRLLTLLSMYDIIHYIKTLRMTYDTYKNKEAPSSIKLFS